MFSCRLNIVGLSKCFYLIKINDVHKNLISKCTCPLYFSTSSKLLQSYGKGSKANMTEEEHVGERIIENFKAAAKDPRVIKQGFNKFVGECGKYYDECKGKIAYNRKEFDWQDRTGEVDIAFKFETEEELKRFVVNTDEVAGGYSTANFKITQDKTGLFYGTLNTDVPKVGDVIYSGFTNIMSVRPIKSFNRPGCLDWTYYTHLVLKIRGDGRTYMILLSTPDRYDVTFHDQYSYPLYTRGGPYWQITKIPFSHFVKGNKAKINEAFPPVPTKMITRFGISLADSNDGPFKLEIDYVGLERDSSENPMQPYELYYFKKFS